MQTEDISVDVRLAGLTQSEKTKAFADVTIPLGADGVIKISGFSVIQSPGGSPRVAPPARKGKFRYFETIALIGKIRNMVDAAILAEYERLARQSTANQAA